MNEEQLQRAIEFHTQQQAEFYAHDILLREQMEKEFKEFHAANRKLEARQNKFQKTLEALAVLTHDLVTNAQIHARRLDRLERIQPQ